MDGDNTPFQPQPGAVNWPEQPPGQPAPHAAAHPQSFHALPPPPAPATNPNELPQGLRALTWIVTGMKAIPLIISVFSLLFFASLIDSCQAEIERELDIDPDATIDGVNRLDGWDEFFDDIGNWLVLIAVALLVVGGGLLLLQFIGALRHKATMLAAIASILAIIDLLFLVASFANLGDSNADGQAGPIVLLAIVAAAQAAIAIWAIKRLGRTSSVT